MEREFNMTCSLIGEKSMRMTITLRNVIGKTLMALAIATLLYLPLSNVFGVQPSYAASTTSNSQGEVERAYEEFGEDAGIREEIYQQRLQEGQNPEKMPRPYGHIESFADRTEVPETSLVEKTVSKVRQVLKPDAGKE
jgi:hypothetical protein